MPLITNMGFFKLLLDTNILIDFIVSQDGTEDYKKFASQAIRQHFSHKATL